MRPYRVPAFEKCASCFTVHHKRVARWHYSSIRSGVSSESERNLPVNRMYQDSHPRNWQLGLLVPARFSPRKRVKLTQQLMGYATRSFAQWYICMHLGLACPTALELQKYTLPAPTLNETRTCSFPCRFSTNHKICKASSCTLSVTVLLWVVTSPLFLAKRSLWRLPCRRSAFPCQGEIGPCHSQQETSGR